MILFNKITCQIASSIQRLRLYSTSNKKLIVERLTGKHEGIVVFGLNRADAKNSFDQELCQNFFEALDSVQYDRLARVVILRSMVPGIFCAGADLKARAKMRPEDVAPFVSRLSGGLTDLENLPMPVITAIDGAALGGGLEVALATDIRVAADNVKLGLVETKLAIIPGAGGTQRLPRVVGVPKAKEMIYTAAILTGQEAAEINLVNYCVAQNEQGDSAYQKALSIAEKILVNGPIGVKMAKTAINKGIEVDISSGLDIEKACYAQVIPTKDRIEGLAAFREKRTPNYKGE